MNIVLDPLQAESLIVQTGVRDCAGGKCEGWSAEEAEISKTVVDGDPHDRTGGVFQEGDGVAE